MRVIHIRCACDADPLQVLSKHFQKIDPQKAYVVVATAQHLHTIGDAVDFLKSKGIKARAGGQVLGCDQQSAFGDEDAVIYIGSGRFHPLGIAKATGKKILIVNPISGTFDFFGEKDIKRISGKRKAAIAAALSSERFGIMLSSKKGQKRIEKAIMLRDLLESNGKRAWIFAASELSPPNLLPFKVDVLVNTACPRICEDIFHVPVISSKDLEDALALGKG